MAAAGCAHDRVRRAPKIAPTLAASLVAALLGASPCACADEASERETHRVAPYADTPGRIVDEMLKLAGVGPNDFVVDLGSGDGRLAIAAVKAFGARGAFGVDIDQKLVDYARSKAVEEGVADRVQFFARDLFATDVSRASVVTIYLFPGAMARVRDKLLRELAPGSRVVSHDFPLPGWHIERIETFAAPEKNLTVGRGDAVLFLYTVPERSGAAAH